MNKGIRKFRELLLTDKAFQQKLKAASEAYTGEQTDEAVFRGVLVPVASEYGISATYDEFRAFIPDDQEVDNEELAQIVGGKVRGAGQNYCCGIGFGFGGGGGEGTGDFCMLGGVGWGGYDCWGSGKTVNSDYK